MDTRHLLLAFVLVISLTTCSFLSVLSPAGDQSTSRADEADGPDAATPFPPQAGREQTAPIDIAATGHPRRTPG